MLGSSIYCHSRHCVALPSSAPVRSWHSPLRPPLILLLAATGSITHQQCHADPRRKMPTLVLRFPHDAMAARSSSRAFRICHVGVSFSATVCSNASCKARRCPELPADGPGDGRSPAQDADCADSDNGDTTTAVGMFTKSVSCFPACRAVSSVSSPTKPLSMALNHTCRQ